MTGTAWTTLVVATCFAVVAGGCATSSDQKPRDVEAGPIWNQADAEQKCPALASKLGGRWNGQWVTTRWGEMSVCGIVGGRSQ